MGMMDIADQQFDVIVIGAGIMGSATAYELAKRGDQKVLLLEQFDFLHHRGSSHGESRTMRATYPDDYYCAMTVESSRLWEEAESEIGYKVYFKCPHFDMGPSDNKPLRAIISSCRKTKSVGGCRVLDRGQVEEEFAGRIKLPEGWIGVCTELGGVIKPTKAVSMFQTLALKNGAVLRDRAEVRGIVKDDKNGGIRVVVGGDGERIWGRKCVVTVGAWTEKLVKRVCGIELPMQPVENTVCYWRVKEGEEGKLAIGGGFPAFASYGKPGVYGTPSLEFPGLIKITVVGGVPCDPDKRAWGPGKSEEELKEWIRETFGGLVATEGGPVAKLSCMCCMTPDKDYVIDFLGGEFGKDVVVGGGFSGHGFKMGPIVGKILADLAVNGETEAVEEGILRYFRIHRFVENPLGNHKDFR